MVNGREDDSIPFQKSSQVSGLTYELKQCVARCWILRSLCSVTKEVSCQRLAEGQRRLRILCALQSRQKQLSREGDAPCLV